MRDRIGFAWRLFATGLCFAVFGVGGLILALVIFPAITYCWPSFGQPRWRRVQGLICACFGTYLRMVKTLGIGKVTIIGAERLANTDGALVLANHPTLLDVVALIAYMPQADCVVKQALWRNPFLGGVVRSAGYVSNASPDGVLEECVRLLRANRSLVVFPEGTRTVPGKPLRFQRGAARLALRSGATILPVTMTCEPATLMKHTRWYQIPERRWHIRIVVHEPVRMEKLVDCVKPESVAVRHLTQALESLFERKLTEHGNANK